MEGYRAFQIARPEVDLYTGAVMCEHRRPKSICGECFPTETKIDRDREFDQTAKTEPPAAIGTHAERRVSPSIVEFRNQELAAENIDLKERLAVANERIAGFERMAAGLAAKIDEFERGFQAVTGATAAEFAAAKAVKPHEFDPNRCYRPCTTPLGIAACILDNNHDGMCEGA